MKTKKEFEQYLNDMQPCLREDCMIIGGKRRRGSYGTMLRKYDPLCFEVGFNEFCLKKW